MEEGKREEEEEEKRTTNKQGTEELGKGGGDAKARVVEQPAWIKEDGDEIRSSARTVLYCTIAVRLYCNTLCSGNSSPSFTPALNGSIAVLYTISLNVGQIPTPTVPDAEHTTEEKQAPLGLHAPLAPLIIATDSLII